ncbi:MAG: hypothetical protein F6K16_00220 [Symploca sp. SIO2B6]|nr:hypothetical protein [Symploca sp. SIO2B6]
MGERNFAWDLNSPCLERLRVWASAYLFPHAFFRSPPGDYSTPLVARNFFIGKLHIATVVKV